MTKSFENLRAGMSGQARAKARTKAGELRAQMPLHELRQARGLSQTTLAQKLHVQQPAIAKLEKRTDMYISTLRNHIQAMGGNLRIIATFPEGQVEISNFEDLGNPAGS